MSMPVEVTSFKNVVTPPRLAQTTADATAAARGMPVFNTPGQRGIGRDEIVQWIEAQPCIDENGGDHNDGR